MTISIEICIKMSGEFNFASHLSNTTAVKLQWLLQEPEQYLVSDCIVQTGLHNSLFLIIKVK
jgi:hypothetical protein